MIFWLEKNALMALAQNPQHIVDAQALMPLGEDGEPIGFGELEPKFLLSRRDTQGVEWIPFSHPEFTPESLAPVIALVNPWGITVPQNAFISSGIPEGFVMVFDE